MTNFKMMITPEGKHPAAKWAELAADEIIDISSKAPSTLMSEAMDFRRKLVEMMTHHHQTAMDDEQAKIATGSHDMNMPYETEVHALKVVDEIVGLAQNYSFAPHFKQDAVCAHLGEVCNRNFKSAKLVERSHFHSERAKDTPQTTKKKK